eukprot:9922298-Heterocapsa_arctica.AAC.1
MMPLVSRNILVMTLRASVLILIWPSAYGPGGGGTLDQELHAASAKTRRIMVELWLIDTGCAHDLVSLADITRSGDRLRPLTENVNFQTANGAT